MKDLPNAMTNIGALFVREIDRGIEGVIKADDQAHLAQELEEYVVTGEVERRLEPFLRAYNDPGLSNGVWISGFFGSGKSHLLKMLAMLLENRDVDGKGAWDRFREKVADEPMLAGLMERAVRARAESILFNIDQKADVIAKNQPDALLAVFQKVFDEHRGFYGKQPHIAWLERDLQSRELLEPFRQAYGRLAGKTWERGREQALLEGGNIDRAVAEVAGGGLGEARDVLGRYRRDLRISIEDFANDVEAYLTVKGPGHRLNFMVDEVGQYIADNVKLMTNLQTVAESLATRCRGRAWVMVTAQQDMDAVLGQWTRTQENDFSKIQARFAERMSLTSADVAEVIAKRLLAKTPNAERELAALHAQVGPNLRTLFTFADDSQQLRQFKGEEDFVERYPFIPYQFPLLQQAMQGLSGHNAFEGRYSSVGERPMLQVFRDAAIRLKDRPLGDVAAFDRLYDGIAPSLKADVQQAVLRTERNLNDPFAVRVLKALFLVKYVQGFRASARNVAILLVDRLTDDPAGRLVRVKDALAKLERETLVRREGEFWEFLTNEEQDVDKEIGQVELDIAELRRDLEELFLNEAVRERKIRHDASGQEFDFARMIDDQTMGRAHELGVNIVSPLHDAPNADAARMRTLANDELVVLPPADDLFLRDLRTYRQTLKFVRLETGQGSDARRRILAERGQRNDQLRRRLVDRARALTGEAQLFARGEELTRPAGSDGSARIAAAFGTLVDKVHTNLPMLGGRRFVESDVAAAFREAAQSPSMDTGLNEPEREILAQAGRDTQRDMRTTVRALVQKFGAKPYGWNYHAVLATVAALLARGRLEARLDGAVLTAAAAEKALGNDRLLEKIVLEAQAEFTPAQVRDARRFLRDMFDHEAPPAADARVLGQEAAARIAALDAELAVYATQARKYPFLAALDALTGEVRAVKGKPPAWFLGEMDEATRERLLDLREAALDPVRAFMGGQGKATFDAATAFLRDEAANLDAADRAKAEALRAALAAPELHRQNGGRALLEAFDALRTDVGRIVEAARTAAAAEVTALIERLRAAPDYQAADEAVRAGVERIGAQALSAIGAARLVAVARDLARRFREEEYPRLLGLLVPLPIPKPVLAGGVREPGSDAAPGAPATPPPPPPPVYVTAGQIAVPFAKTYLADKTDVDAYVEALREAMAAAVSQGKRITV